MMKLLWKRVFLICIVVMFSVIGCSKEEPAEPEVQAEQVEPEPLEQVSETDDPEPVLEAVSPLTGRWRSVRMDGADIGNFVKEITYTFGGDGSFVAEAVMTDGGTDNRQGTFTVEGNQMLQIVGGVSLKRRFEFQDQMLVISDPYLDSTIWFEKQPPE